MARGERADEDAGVRVSEPAATLPDGAGYPTTAYLVPVDPMDQLQCDSCQ